MAAASAATRTAPPMNPYAESVYLRAMPGSLLAAGRPVNRSNGSPLGG
jgi:hypothetical protein